MTLAALCLGRHICPFLNLHMPCWFMDQILPALEEGMGGEAIPRLRGD